jgi:membrane protease YdiL (CAAX protease family)
VFLTLPLMLIYEVLILYFRFDKGHYIRNAADVWIKYFIQHLGVHGTFVFGVLILLFASFGFVSMVREKQDVNVKFAFIAILESSIYAWLLALLATRLTSFVLVHLALSEDAQAKLVLSIGAGVYEELIFRAIGYGFIPYAIMLLFRAPDRKKKKDVRRQIVNQRVGFEVKIFAALVSSLLFAWLHNVSSFSLTDYTTLYRFCMGLLFCVIYEFRGLGVAVWTHTLYDIIVFSVA